MAAEAVVGVAPGGAGDGRVNLNAMQYISAMVKTLELAISTGRKGIYVMDDEERAAVREGLEQARRGEFVSEGEMDGFWKGIGV
jgi:predicted transcriptional regulator